MWKATLIPDSIFNEFLTIFTIIPTYVSAPSSLLHTQQTLRMCTTKCLCAFSVCVCVHARVCARSFVRMSVRLSLFLCTRSLTLCMVILVRTSSFLPVRLQQR